MPDEMIANDSTETMDPAGEGFQQMAQQLLSEGDDTPQAADQKVAEASADATDSGAAEEEAGDDKDKQIAGLKKELSRVRGDNRRVEALEAEIQNLRQSVAQTRAEDANAQISDDMLIQRNEEWQEELNSARVKAEVLQYQNDTEGAQAAAQRIQQAKQQLRMISDEVRKRRVARQEQQASQQVLKDRAVKQMTDIVAKLAVKHPELNDKNSDIYRKSEEIFNENRDVMAPLGPMGEMLAVATAIVFNPELVGAKIPEKARKDLLNELEGKATSKMFKSPSGGSTRPAQDFHQLVNTPGGLEKFNKLRNQIVGAS